MFIQANWTCLFLIQFEKRKARFGSELQACISFLSFFFNVTDRLFTASVKKQQKRKLELQFYEIVLKLNDFDKKKVFFLVKSEFSAVLLFLVDLRFLFEIVLIKYVDGVCVHCKFLIQQRADTIAFLQVRVRYFFRRKKKVL